MAVPRASLETAREKSQLSRSDFPGDWMGLKMNSCAMP